MNLVGLLFSQATWFTFPGRAVAISGKIFGLLFSLTIWFTFPGRAVANMILLVYFLVNIFWFTFREGSTHKLNFVGLLFSDGLLTRALTSRDWSLCWFTLVYLVFWFYFLDMSFFGIQWLLKNNFRNPYIHL